MMIMTERLLEKEEVGAPEIWDIFHKTPRIPQVLYAFYCAALYLLENFNHNELQL